MSWDKLITVNLNSDSTGNFYTGDIVTGTVILELEKTQKIDNIYLEVVGICKAQWTRSCPTIPYIKIYSDKKKVFCIKMDNVFESACNGGKIRAGVYSYPFHFALPQDLPSTFKSSTASVDYFIKIRSKSSYKFKKNIPLNIMGNVNINNVEEMLAPCSYEFKRQFKSLDAEFTLHIKTYKAISSRQSLPFRIVICNEKKVMVSKLKAALVQKLRYTVPSGWLEEERKVNKTEYKNIGNIVAEICDFDMEIPQLNPSTLYMTDPMIEISYEIQIEVIFPFHRNLYETIPVIVASVPVIHYESL